MNKKTRHCIVTKFGEQTVKKVQTILSENDIAIKKHVGIIEVQKNNEYAFLFPTGIIVDWSKDSAITKQLNAFTEHIVRVPLHDVLIEQYAFQWTETQFKITDDTLFIPRKKIKILLAVSFALSQSTQLDYKEQKIEKIFSRIEKISRTLMTEGKIQMKSSKIKKMIGSILTLQHDMSMHGMANDTPEFFWEEPTLSTYYNQTAVYVELKNRFEVVEQKIAAMHTALDVLRDEVNVQHSHALEWVIIILICLEFLPLLFEYIH